jgi:MFS family permease
MGLPAGKLVDKGYFRHVILAGTVIHIFRSVPLSVILLFVYFACSLFMLSLAHIDRYYQIFLAQGIGLGLGSGLIYLPSMVVQAHHWRARRALAMGVVITGMLTVWEIAVCFHGCAGSSVGGIVYPIMLNHLFHGPVGFAWGVRASAFLNLGLLISANLLMSARLPSDKNQPEKPKPNTQQILRDSPFIIAVLG